MSKVDYIFTKLAGANFMKPANFDQWFTPLREAFNQGGWNAAKKVKRQLNLPDFVDPKLAKMYAPPVAKESPVLTTAQQLKAKEKFDGFDSPERRHMTDWHDADMAS